MGSLQGKGIWTLYDDVGTACAIAPVVGAKYIICKVSKKGAYDTAEAAKALAEVRKNPSLVPVAWMYNSLDDPVTEADCIKRAFADGFAAMILDVEGDSANKFPQANDLVFQVTALNLDLSNIYLCGDPRLNTKIDIFPYAVLSAICRGGFMPMTYGELMPSDKPKAASAVLTAAYAEYDRHKVEMNYSIPPMPILAPYWDNAGKSRMTRDEFKKWCNETQFRNPTFVSLYRAGVTLPEAYVAYKELKTTPTVVIATQTAGQKMTMVQPGGPGFRLFAVPPKKAEDGWTTQFIDKGGNTVRVRPSSTTQTMVATYLPSIPKAGRYAIETYIPGEHATTKSAQYFIVSYQGAVRQETKTVVNQLNFSDTWVPLGTFELDPKNADTGRVNLVDLTTDDKVREVAYTAIRWRPVVSGGPGFDAPIGTAEERGLPQMWPGKWTDSNPYLTKYALGYHTGADLNLNFPFHNADKGQPVYAAADGVVVNAGVVQGSWRGLIVIRHDPLPNGTPVYTRYGHVENIMVKKGDAVVRGQQMATVGLFGPAEGQNYHLHFDISTTSLLEKAWQDWPGDDIDKIKANYVDPLRFIQDHRP